MLLLNTECVYNIILILLLNTKGILKVFNGELIAILGFYMRNFEYFC